MKQIKISGSVGKMEEEEKWKKNGEEKWGQAAF